MHSNEVKCTIRFVCFIDYCNQLQAKLEGVLRTQIKGGMELIQVHTTKKYFIESTHH